MTPEFEYYHGVALRSLIIDSPVALSIEKFDNFGRTNTYLLNDVLAVHIKHSSKRLNPWSFSFSAVHFSELLYLLQKGKAVWALFVCGQDGVVGLSLKEITSITTARPGGVASIRIDRNRGEMYRVYGNEGQLTDLKPRGVAALIEALAPLTSS